jgi:CRISPR-associated protein Csm1
MEALKWRALFKYSAERNIGKNIKDDTKKAAIREEFDNVAAWLDSYGGKLKIALWNVIYNNR